VTSKIDSRTILTATARNSSWRGDMPPAAGLVRFRRLHGPYILNRRAPGWRAAETGQATYDTTVTADEKGQRPGTARGIRTRTSSTTRSRIVVSSGQASISYLQRRLRIGFSRAARLVDMMEMDGLVSAAAGGKPREVLVKKEYFDEVDAQLR
jgi:S-DNA-T family DNA segregation ATPase FtsK/SpoIIIE